MMPISDPRDRFFYPHHTPMKDTYFLAYWRRILHVLPGSHPPHRTGLNSCEFNTWVVKEVMYLGCQVMFVLTADGIIKTEKT